MGEELRSARPLRRYDLDPQVVTEEQQLGVPHLQAALAGNLYLELRLKLRLEFELEPRLQLWEEPEAGAVRAACELVPRGVVLPTELDDNVCSSSRGGDCPPCRCLCKLQDKPSRTHGYISSLDCVSVGNMYDGAGGMTDKSYDHSQSSSGWEHDIEGMALRSCRFLSVTFRRARCCGGVRLDTPHRSRLRASLSHRLHSACIHKLDRRRWVRLRRQGEVGQSRRW